jgi:hypothetical protein
MAALTTEEAVGFIGMTAGRAEEIQFAPALLTELCPFFILRLALRAFHLFPPRKKKAPRRYIKSPHSLFWLPSGNFLS